MALSENPIQSKFVFVIDGEGNHTATTIVATPEPPPFKDPQADRLKRPTNVKLVFGLPGVLRRNA